MHPLRAGARFILGGVDIVCDRGPVGHSDADVLVHAIIDALLGASGLRDIGHQFPDTDPDFKGISSMILLETTIKMVREKGYDLSNMDVTICLEEPKISEYISPMILLISDAMMVDPDRISVKATTTEKLGFIGAGHGVSAYAVVMIYKKS